MAVRLLFMICLLKFVIGKQEGFIVGGEYVNSIKDFAHVAYLELYGKKSEVMVCGSSILNQKILITAAHCLVIAVNITVYAGTLDKYKGNIHRVDRIKLHEQYDDETLANDIGLVRLKKPLSLGKTMKKVIIMKKPPKVKMAEVAGWGFISDNTREILKYTAQKLWNHKKCKKFIFPEVPDSNGKICGGEMKGQEDYASTGDSGNGLMVNKNIIIGIVCCAVSKSQTLMVYTDVPYYYKWIKVASRKLACS
ncbi:granzyme B-like [Leguminivora glycinivorella]|uniref:granzyme B-like n=1 Tax=Leguminivora glycinivorella TaxID=1035111 RepID=UPI00200BCE46|nr:granzyme B-like [Leguminivora glycinivorella]